MRIRIVDSAVGFLPLTSPQHSPFSGFLTFGSAVRFLPLVGGTATGMFRGMGMGRDTGAGAGAVAVSAIMMTNELDKLYFSLYSKYIYNITLEPTSPHLSRR